MIPSITLYFCGKGHKPRFKATGKMPNPRMDPRNEFNIHLFGYRFAITWINIFEGEEK